MWQLTRAFIMTMSHGNDAYIYIRVYFRPFRFLLLSLSRGGCNVPAANVRLNWYPLRWIATARQYSDRTQKRIDHTFQIVDLRIKEINKQGTLVNTRPPNGPGLHWNIGYDFMIERYTRPSPETNCPIFSLHLRLDIPTSNYVRNGTYMIDCSI